MNTLVRGTHRTAFTRIELIVVLVVLVLVVGFLIPRFVRVRELAKAEECRKNLRNIGVAFRLSGPGSGDNWWTHYTTNQGGTKEWAETGLVFVHFQVMSNELGMNPKLLVCPADREKVAAQGFDKGFSDTNVSYFVGLDAGETGPGQFLTGDRNLATNGQRLSPGLFTMSTNSVLTWTSDLHRDRGNIGSADGSVQFLDQAGLLQATRASELATNRLAIP
jgi:type II secretory pathway pseudopilin PulG